MKTCTFTKSKPAFTLLETLLALFVFSLAVVSLVEAINSMGMASVESRREQQIQQRLELLLLETTRKQDWLKSGPLTSTWDTKISEEDTVYFISVEPLSLENVEKLQLTDLYQVKIAARWKEGEIEQEEVAETWVWSPLFEVKRSL